MSDEAKLPKESFDTGWQPHHWQTLDGSQVYARRSFDAETGWGTLEIRRVISAGAIDPANARFQALVRAIIKD